MLIPFASIGGPLDTIIAIALLTGPSSIVAAITLFAVSRWKRKKSRGFEIKTLTGHHAGADRKEEDAHG